MIESKMHAAREVYCVLCKTMLRKSECQKVRIVKAKRFRVKRHGSYRGKKNPMFGKHHTEETKAKISARLIRRRNSKAAAEAAAAAKAE